ncbi:TPA: isopentenyl phosphate kinase family protein [Candidatus Micrarchaeota archaeon]|nr:isopentenyl phosphate kinase family protein [Candidatus Micrarchaeota archaeon]
MLKLGGSAITVKGGYMKANSGSIAALSKAVAAAWKTGVRDLIIVHGAGSFGHALVLKYGIGNGVVTMEEQKGCRETQEACEKLSSMVVAALQKQGVPAASIPPHSLIISKNKRIETFDEKPVLECLTEGSLPVLYGDMVMDSELGFSVCSGDQIIAFLAKWADRVVMASNVEGILMNGKVVPKITSKNFAKIRKHLSGSKSPDVTGGMAGKVAELLKVKAPIYIVNAAKPERVTALLLGKGAVCTEIRF